MDASASPPDYAFEHAALLHPHANVLHSPPSLLAPEAHQVNSPSWSNEFHAIAASLGLAPQPADASEDAAGSGGGGGGLHATGNGGFGQRVCHGVRHSTPYNDAAPAGVWQPLGLAYDAEALITLQHPTLGGGNGEGSSSAR